MSFTEYVENLISRDTGKRDYKPFYIPEGDCVVYYADDTPCHAVRLDDVITLYVADDDPARLVGCQVKNVVKSLRRYGPFGIEICRGGQLKLGMLFVLAGVRPEVSQLGRRFFDSGLAMQGVDIPEELCRV